MTSIIIVIIIIDSLLIYSGFYTKLHINYKLRVACDT